MTDSVTKNWIRNASDELAVANGCRFDEERGQFVVDWIQKYLRLYEGESAGEPLYLRDWQLDCTLRMFGWIRWSDRWNRWIRRFNQASVWVPKKNKKSPTLAAWGLYLFIGDGEPGQKVYLAAKDGSQSREIAGKHMMEMAAQSPEIMSECTPNRSLMQITHEPTRSIIKPISSGDARAQKAKEGLNGSVLVDETHVVDRAFMNRVSRAGISRSEPFMIEVSTAGNDPDSYGKSRHDYGKQVECGNFKDERFFFAAYEAPQDLTDDDLAKDPVKYGKMANPAWGHTVGEDEYLDDYNRSKISISELAEFKMYRLNVWQRAANPWLKSGDWVKCYKPFSLEDFEGEDCWLALDKSKTRDMTAVVQIFRGERDDEYYQFPHFWLPQVTAEENNHLVSFLQWAHDGYLNLIPGEVIQDEYLEDLISDLDRRFNIQGIWYDKTFAEDITQRLEADLGIERTEFRQSSDAFAGPIGDYERLVIQGTLHHNNHPILNWQAGHCSIRVDHKGRKILVKPEHGDIKKIDGIVAGVMGIFAAINAPRKKKSVYAKRGVIVV